MPNPRVLRRNAAIARCVAAMVETLESRMLFSSISGTSGGFDVTDQLVFTSIPTNMVKTGVPMTVQVTAEDGAGMVDASFTGAVTLSDLYSNDYDGTSLEGKLTVNAVNGVARFTGISQEFATANTYNNQYDTFYADSGKCPQGVSSGFAIYQDTLSFLTQPPTNITAGSAFDVQIGAVDSSGNLDTSFQGIVVLWDHYAANGGTLNGNNTVKAVNGIATFKGITQDTATEGSFGESNGPDMLYAYGYDSGMPNSNSDQFRIQPAAASQLAFVTDPTDTNGDSNTVDNAPLSVEVDAEDQYGNLAPDFSGNITLSFGPDSGAATFGGKTTVLASKGAALFTDVTIDTTGFYELKASGFGTALSDDFDVTEQLVFSTEPPATISAGDRFDLTVSAEDGAGHVDATFTGSVTLYDAYSNNYYLQPIADNTTVDAVAGVATFTGVSQFYVTGTNNPDIFYADSDGFQTAVSNGVDITPDVVTFAAPPPTSVSAGNPFSVSIEIEDAAGNLDTAFNSPVYVSSMISGSTIGTSVQAVNGIAVFNNLTEIAQSVQGTSQDVLDFNTDSGASTSCTIAVTPSSGQLAFVNTPTDTNGDGVAIVNAPLSVQVKSLDADGNFDPSFNGNVTLTLGANPPGYGAVSGTLTVAAVNGVASFTNVMISQPGDGYTLVATGDGVVTSNAFNVVNGDEIVFTSPIPPTMIAGEPENVSVAIENGAGDIDTSFNGQLTIQGLDQLVNATAVNGVATFSGIASTYASDGYSFQVFGDTLPGANSSGFSVIGGPATQIVFDETPTDANDSSTETNTPLTAKVRAVDQYYNTAPSFNGNVTLTLASQPDGASLGGTLTVAAVQGIATFDNLLINRIGDNFTLAASSSVGTFTSDTFSVGDQLVFATQPPGSVAAGASFSVVVDANDGAGNLDTSFNGPVTVSNVYSYYFGAPLRGNLTVNAVNGVATFDGLSDTMATSGEFAPDVIFADGADSPEITSNPLNVTPARATQLIFLNLPADTDGDSGIVANKRLSLQVAAEDQFGNIDSNFNGNITLTLGNNPSNAFLGGSTTLTAVDGIANYNDLTISAIGKGYTLVASA